jgi:hypothetical protein
VAGRCRRGRAGRRAVRRGFAVEHDLPGRAARRGYYSSLSPECFTLSGQYSRRETARREKVAESYRYYLEEIESSRDGLGSRHYAGTIIPHPYTEEEEAEHRRKQAERRSEAEASIKRVLAEEDWLRAEVEVQQAKDAHKRNALRAAESAWLEEEKRWESRFTPFNRDIPSGAKASFIAKYLREQGVSVSGY